MNQADQSGYFEQYEKASNKLLFSVSIGLFVSMFMIVFQPFGVTNYDPAFRINLQFVATMLFIGAMVSAALLLSEFLLRPFLIKNLSRKSLIGWLIWIYLLTGTLIFLVYNYLGEFHDFRWLSYLRFLWDVGMVITFPVVGFMFYLRHQALQSKYINLQSIPPVATERLLSFNSENGKDQLIVSLSDVLYLESEDNYVSIFYLENENTKSHLIRSSLKRVFDLLDEPNLARCHRSFIVNLGRVRSCRGNRHGLHLKLEGMDGIVPVSRNFTESILNSLQASSLTKVV